MINNYYRRIVDKELELKLKTFGAIHITGPKWCGKTTTAQQKAKSALKFQKDPDKEGLIYTAQINPSILLQGEKPRLIDEWQDVPNIWDAVRAYCDDYHEKGLFILTGSTSKKVKTLHTGTGRISKIKMYPMSLYESKESNGSVSLKDLFNGSEKLEKGCISNLTIEDLINAAVRGGWPESVLMDDKQAHSLIAKDYFQQIYEEDMFKIDDIKRNKETMRAVIRSYARNISTLCKKTNILKDVNATNAITDKTLDDYISVLEQLYIIEDLYGWSPSIRSSSAMRSGRKREFIDPSIAIAALGVSKDYLNTDLKTFSFIFECLCIRDLKIYSSINNGELSYYHDKTGLEADAVLHLDDGRYALIEFKLGSNEIDEGANHLNKIEELILKQTESNKRTKLKSPNLKLIITGTKYGYRRDDGVLVVPIGCLKD